MTEHAINRDLIATDRGNGVFEVHDLDLLAEWFLSTNSHSAFSASGSAMWLNCAGSLIPNLLLPDESGPDAAYGTVAHMVAEIWLRDGHRPDYLVGTNEFIESGNWGYLIDIDEEMLDYVQQCIDWVDLLPGEIYYERRVDFSPITPIPNQGGTADFLALTLKKMIITDWKFGQGVTVYAEKNSQGLLYGLGAFYEFDHIYHFEEIEIRIAQPRLNHFDTWTITRAELLEFAEYAKFRAKLAWDVNAPRSPSEKACMWCKVKDCAAQAKLNMDLLAGVFTDLDQPLDIKTLDDFKFDLDLMIDPKLAQASSLTTAELAKLAGYRKMAERWWKSVANELYRRAIGGEKVPDYKLVESRSRRVFRSPKATAAHLMSLGLERDQVYTQTMASPNQAEELLKGLGYRTKELPDLLDAYIFKPPGKATLVPNYDKRQSLDDLADSVFEDVSDEPEIEDDNWSI